MSIMAGTVLRGQSFPWLDDSESVRFDDISDHLAAAMQSVLETVAETEVEARLGCRLHERSACRSDYRNGYRSRTVQTTYRSLTIQVPRLRGQGYVPSFVQRGERGLKEIEEWVAHGFLCGLSRIDIIRQLEATCGCRPSDGVLARVQAELDRQAKVFKNRALTGRYVYLYLDAAWVKDIVGQKAGRVCVLTALAITDQGEKELLGFERVKQETQSAWVGFLGRLVARGLNPADLGLVISDENGGITTAVPQVLGDVAHQLCWAHRMRNAVKAVSLSDRPEVVKSLKAIYEAANKREAGKACGAFAQRWSGGYPALVRSVCEDQRHLLAFLDCPPLHWRYLRTSNPIERVFVELRRRRYGCGAFANTLACDRVLFSVYRLLNERWAGQNIWEARRRLLAKKAQ